MITVINLIEKHDSLYMKLLILNTFFIYNDSVLKKRTIEEIFFVSIHSIGSILYSCPVYLKITNFATNVIIGKLIAVLTKNTISKSFRFSGISDLRTTAPVSVKYIS